MTEEAGMDGAFGLQANWLQADILINTDSEEEGEILHGCAGGIDFITTLPLSREAIPAGFQTFKLTLKGLKGGHSGGDIHLGLGNANKLLARFWLARLSWICVWWISTVAHCAMPFRVKPSRPWQYPQLKLTS